MPSAEAPHIFAERFPSRSASNLTHVRRLPNGTRRLARLAGRLTLRETPPPRPRTVIGRSNGGRRGAEAARHRPGRNPGRGYPPATCVGRDAPSP